MQNETDTPGIQRHFKNASQTDDSICGQKYSPTSTELIEIHAIGTGNPKRRGEAGEAAFLAKASSLGFSVSKPWGDSDRYDFVLDSGHGLLRVQVKSVSCYSRSRYSVKASGNTALYTKAEIDFLVAYIVPENLWYVLPVESFAPRTMLRFNPHGPGRAMFEKYREAWCLLACSRKARGWKDIPVLCRCQELTARCAVCPQLN